MEKSQKKKILITIIIMSILALTCVFNTIISVGITNFFFFQNIITKRDNLMVHFISVGQGDAIAINLPDDKIVLIDTGTTDYSVEYTNYLYENVLSSEKNKYIDYLILTHADADHIGGSKRLIQEFNLRNVVLPFVDSETKIYSELKSAIDEKDINTQIVGSVDISANDYKIKFYYIDDTDTNASSTVVKLSYKNSDFLFTGDIDIETENKLIELYGEELDCDVLKVAHHGSKMSTSIEFLEVVTPNHAIISCAKNSYGHPTDTVLKNLSDIGAKIHRTDVDGNIVCFVDNLIGFKILKGEYHITNLWFNYVIFVLIVEILVILKLFVDILIVLRKKSRDKKLLVKKS